MDDSRHPRGRRADAAIRAALAGLAERLGPGAISTAGADVLAASGDAGLDRAVPLAVVRPSSTADVAATVRWAVDVGASVVARGAGTGLAGGAVPGPASIVLALEGLDTIAIEPLDRVAVCGPGAVTAAVDAAAAAHGLMYPPDPASWLSSTVGGNAATNAGGPRCLKYGVTAAYVQGLTAVLADGRTVRLGGRALDPSGPDVIGLLVGSEGTLAIITELVLRLVPRPTAAGTLLAAFDDAVAAGAAVAAIVARGLVPAAIELMDRAMLALIAADRDEDGDDDGDVPAAVAAGPDGAAAAAALDDSAAAVLIIEVDGHPSSIAPQLAAVAAAVAAAGGRCRVATDEAERAALWSGRRRAGLALLRLTGAYHTADVAVPPSRLPAMIAAVEAICAARGRSYGLVAHAGDGNLHPLVPFDARDDADARAVAACVAEIAAAAVAAGGTISGEHGVGLAKRAYLPWLYDRPTLNAMRDVKAALDPRGTLNPGKVLPAAGDPGAPWPRDDAPPGPAAPQTSPTSLFDPSIAAPRSPTPLAAAPKAATPASAASAIAVAPDDLVLTASADATLADAVAAARAAGRLLPIASPWPDASLRDVIGQRLEAPWRTRYGAIGDNVLTVEVVLSDGRAIRAGRAVRKHVAGYALGRLFVGAGGALGRIETVGLRLVPAPPSRMSLVAGAADARAALAAALAARAAGLGLSAVLAAPSSAALAARPALAELIGGAAWTVIATAEGHGADVGADGDAMEGSMRAALGPRSAIHRVDHGPGDLGGVAVWATAVAAASDRAPVARRARPTSALSIAMREAGGAVVLVDVLGGQLFVRAEGRYVDGGVAAGAGVDADADGRDAPVGDPRGDTAATGSRWAPAVNDMAGRVRGAWGGVETGGCGGAGIGG